MDLDPKKLPGGLQIVESLAGTFFYHLARETPAKALCGARTMATGLPLTQWGYRGHLGERYCAICVNRALHPDSNDHPRSS